MSLIKRAKGLNGACVKNVPRIERPTTVGEKRTDSIILEVSHLQPTSSLDHNNIIITAFCPSLGFLGMCAEQREVKLALNYALNSEQHLTTTFYGTILLYSNLVVTQNTVRETSNNGLSERWTNSIPPNRSTYRFF